MKLTFNVDQDIKQIKRALVAGGLSVALILGSAGMASAADRDRDDDGLTNMQEKIVKTNPDRADSDRDGVKDGKEDRDDDGLNNLRDFGLKYMADEDKDDDTLENDEEYPSGTSPTDDDTDDENGDGVEDGDDDSDDDGLEDDEEELVDDDL